MEIHRKPASFEPITIKIETEEELTRMIQAMTFVYESHPVARIANMCDFIGQALVKHEA